MIFAILIPEGEGGKAVFCGCDNRCEGGVEVDGLKLAVTLTGITWRMRAASTLPGIAWSVSGGVRSSVTASPVVAHVAR